MDQELISRLTDSHLRRLRWFESREGEVSYWPQPLDGGLLVVSLPKGIYKPQGMAHAVSVRINLDSPYSDGEVILRPDGSWYFAYHQEGSDPLQRDREYTNVAMMACIRDSVPVGVLRERPRQKKNDRPQYDLLGLAYPVRWQDGYFYLDSNPRVGHGRDIVVDVLTETAVKEESEAELQHPPPKDDYDARLRLLRQIVARQGQPAFRKALLKAYANRCAVTGCETAEVLEAAHLRPYRGPESNSAANGLLLRADIHTLLDLRLIAIDPATRTVAVSKALGGTQYAELGERPLTEPQSAAALPHIESLETVWSEFQSAEQQRA